MNMSSNRGGLQNSKKCMVPGYDFWVWFTTMAMTDIICLNNLICLYWVTYDSEHQMAFIVRWEEFGLPNMIFDMHSCGLHVYHPKKSNVQYGCVQTVAENIDLSSLLGSKFWTRLLGSWKHVSRSRYVLIRKLWEIKVWFLYLKESSNEWWYMCILCRILHDPVVFDTCYWWTHVPSVLCGCARRRVYVHGSVVIGLVWVPIQVLLCTRWYLSTS